MGFNSGFKGLNLVLPILLPAPPKAWFYGRSLAGIAYSNTAGGMDVSFDYCQVERSQRRGDHSSR